MPSSNELVVIETPVTDFLYGHAPNAQLRDAFLASLNPENPPRKGDNITISAEEWREKLLDFGRTRQEVRSSLGSGPVEAEQVRDIVFGKPRSIEPGGSLANTFDTLVKATLDDKPITDGRFVTAIGEGIAGKVFADSLPGKLVMPEAKGCQLEAHIIPLDGDRIIISLPSFTQPPSDYMSASQLDSVCIDKNTKMVMLGGYMTFTGKYNQFLDAVLDKVAAVSENPKERPTIVLTTAAQCIAETQELKTALERASAVSHVIVSANTGEFRRLLGVDSDWRKPFEANWWFDTFGNALTHTAPEKASLLAPVMETGIQNLQANGWKKLEGCRLEDAKESDRAYQVAKLFANERAYRYAFDTYCRNKQCPVTFVVTNGKKGVHVVNGKDGISNNYPVPPAPNGVINTVGAGDGFLAGYLLGDIKKLAQEYCVELGFVCSGQIIGRDEARLQPQSASCVVKERAMKLGGLPAYLNPKDYTH
ncbi:MAG: PfkB family carbohydrate kinase, partial [Alphaproteobacteria bacterium]|nr:PfkB family carbohydrate kinase [Alphaproteobacteria bacterium]